MDPAPPPPNHADTVPGFTMQSEAFFLKFVTGLQCGVSSKLLEYETDWYEVMEILLSRLQDEPERKEQFQTIASRDLEYWARIQPGGDTLNLKIRVSLEEKRYFLPPSGSRKTLRLIFNDRFSTQVIFHARKKMLLKSLRELAAIAVADHFKNGDNIKKLETELPRTVIPDVKKSFDNCWTPRFFRSQIVACPPWCACKSWKKPPALTVAGKVKTPTRRELYKKVVGKPVSRKSQQKKVIKKIEVKNNKMVKGSHKSEKVAKQVVQRSNSNKKVKKEVRNEARNDSNKKVKKEAQPESARNSVSKKQDVGKGNPRPIQTKLSPDLKKKVQSKTNAKNSPQVKSQSNPNRSTPSVKKVVMKNVDNVKALKNQVKSMKNKLKVLMDAVATVAAKGKELKSDPKKRKTASDQCAPKRRLSKGNDGSSNNLGNPSKKLKVDETKPKSKEDVFSPRPTRRSVESFSESVESDVKSNAESKRKSKPTNIQSKSGSNKRSSDDAKFTTKSQKQKMPMKSSPREMPIKSSKSKSSKSVEIKMPKIQTLKRVLRSQVQEAPTKKRRRHG